MINIRNVTKNYMLGKVTVEALRGVSLTVSKGDFISIVGPSGSGKTTLMNLIGLLDVPTSGTVMWDDQDLYALNENQHAEIRGKKVGFIFQTFNLIPVFNVYENVEVALLLSKKKMTLKAWKDRINQVIEEVGLTQYIKHKPNELSGGQRQRVAIARALVKNPELIVADEPTANLDSTNAYGIIDLMKQLNKNENTTFIFSTHDDRILKHVDKIIHLEDGKIKI